MTREAAIGERTTRLVLPAHLCQLRIAYARIAGCIECNWWTWRNGALGGSCVLQHRTRALVGQHRQRLKGLPWLYSGGMAAFSAFQLSEHHMNGRLRTRSDA